MALLLAAIAVGVAIVVIMLAGRPWRRPADVRGDWWSKFERDFRAYAEDAASSQQSARRRGGRGRQNRPTVAIDAPAAGETIPRTAANQQALITAVWKAEAW